MILSIQIFRKGEVIMNEIILVVVKDWKGEGNYCTLHRKYFGGDGNVIRND